MIVRLHLVYGHDVLALVIPECIMSKIKIRTPFYSYSFFSHTDLAMKIDDPWPLSFVHLSRTQCVL